MRHELRFICCAALCCIMSSKGCCCLLLFLIGTKANNCRHNSCHHSGILMKYRPFWCNIDHKFKNIDHLSKMVDYRPMVDNIDPVAALQKTSLNVIENFQHYSTNIQPIWSFWMRLIVKKSHFNGAWLSFFLFWWAIYLVRKLAILENCYLYQDLSIIPLQMDCFNKMYGKNHL